MRLKPLGHPSINNYIIKIEKIVKTKKNAAPKSAKNTTKKVKATV